MAALHFIAKRKSTFLFGQHRCLHLAFATHHIPHPSKAASGGEDAYFASPSTNSFGVADGVSQRVHEDADPGVYSRFLLRGCRDAIQKNPRAELRECLASSVQEVRKGNVHGSTTVLLGRIAGNMLETLNLGDCGLMVFRPTLNLKHKLEARLMFQTQSQSYYFNCPFQIPSPEIGNPDLAEALVNSADTVLVSIRAGDVIVAASDGVIDNVFETEMASLVQDRLSEFSRGNCSDALRKLAQRIARAAHNHGKDDMFMSPFAVGARANGINHFGGKLDDVAVVCGLVQHGAVGGQEEELDNFAAQIPTNQ